MSNLEVTRRLSRLQTEVLYLSQRYGPVTYDKNKADGGTWVYVERFPIGSGWNKSQVGILIDIPTSPISYPIAEPQWFWTDINLRTQDGRKINHFFDEDTSHANREYLEKGWGHFCIHVKNWRADGLDITKGDSLISYLELISVVFYDWRKLAKS